MNQLKHLFQPIKVGGVELKNRLVVLGLATGFSQAGWVTDRVKAFYSEIARGGAGLVVFGILPPLPLGHHELERPGIYKDEHIPGLRQVVNLIHAGGAKVAAQIGLEEGYAPSEDAPLEWVGPSDIVVRRGMPTPRPLTLDETHRLVEAHGEATRRARVAGFDAVEFHAGVGFLINRFLSSCTNNRTDDYGGSLEKRMRLLLEIIDAAKKRVGSDYTIMCRISAEEFMERGHGLEESKVVARRLEEAGVKCLDVEAGWHESATPLVQGCVPRGAFAYLAEAIKKVVSVPVVTAYRINDPHLAEQILAEGRADLIGMARAFMADPEFALKAKEGRFDDIRRCIACGHCLDLIFEAKTMACAVNARCGREAEYTIEPAQKPKKVVVVGSGPAGLEAARVAALRGHQVILYERGPELGGQLLVAAVPPYKEEIGNLTRYLAGQVKKLGVEVRLGQEATTSALAQEGAEGVIVATGASPIIPDIPGVNGQNVVSALEVLRSGGAAAGNMKKVAIVGGGLVGCETAEFLVQRGKQVTILEMLGRIGNDIGLSNRWVVLQRLRQAGVRMETRAKAEKISDRGVRASRDGASEFFEADGVVLAVGMRSNDELARQLRGKVPALYSIGDCVEPHRIAEAIEDGFRAGREI